MKISRNSWHFKIIDFHDKEYAWQVARKGTTLCAYFWKVVQCLLLVVMAGVAIAVCVAGLSWVLVIVPVLVLVGTTNSVALVMMPASGFLWACIIAGCIAAFTRHTAKKKDPGLIMSYIAAKKQKFCPRVEVKDEV